MKYGDVKKTDAAVIGSTSNRCRTGLRSEHADRRRQHQGRCRSE